MAKYTPPRQGKAGQIIDVVVLLILTVGALYVPLWLGLAGGAKEPQPHNPTATFEQLGQENPVKIERWAALGYTDPTAEDFQTMVTARFDYWSFSTLELLIMMVVVIGYFVIVVRLSGTEYKEVIAEKFGDRR
jgi:hypothetical protein